MTSYIQKTNEELKAEVFGDYYLDEKFKKMVIADTPFGISDQGELICIPHGAENFRIGIVGSPGSGKTWTLHAVVDRAFDYEDLSVAVVNDYQVEIYSWIYSNMEFESDLARYNEQPYPLPLVNVYLHHKDNEILVSEYTVPSIRMAVPWIYILKNLPIFLGIGKKDKSGKYIKSIIKELSEAESKKEVEDLIDSIGEEADVDLETMKFSIKEKMREILNEEYVDITAKQRMYNLHSKPASLTGSPSAYLKTKYYSKKYGKEREFIAPVFSFLMKLGLVPVLMTYDFTDKDYAANVVAYVLNELFEYPRKYGKNCVIVFPEISTFSSTEEKNLADKALKNIASRGRFRGVYFIYDTQFYDRISTDIRKITAYFFAFNQTDETAKKIAKDFALGPMERKQIIELGIHQFLAIASSTNSFAVYDQYGNRRLERGPFRCKSLPPLSLHSKPKIK